MHQLQLGAMVAICKDVIITYLVSFPINMEYKITYFFKLIYFSTLWNNDNFLGT